MATRELTEAEKVRAIEFADMSAAAPYHDAVCYAAYRGYLLGVEENYFDPDGLVTNDMAATVFSRVIGGDGTLQEYVCDPDALVNRQALAGLLQSAAAITTGGDMAGVIDSMAWAVGKGLFNGVVTGKLHPELAVSRAQLARTLLALDALRYGELARELLGEPAPSPAYTFDGKTLADLQASVDSAVKRNHAVGAQMALIKNGDVVATVNSGWATKNVEAMNDESKMRVASISKIMVGMGAMALAEDGTVSLNAPIGTYWDADFVNPSYPDEDVTIRNILNHTSSIWPAGDNVSRAYTDVKARLSTNRGYTSSKPGAAGSWYYNNYAFAVLGMTLELAAGETMDQIMNAKFFNALNIDAAFEAGSVKTPDTLTTLYREDGTPWRSVSELETALPDPTPGANGRYFSGGFTISAGDLGKLVAILTGDGEYQGLRFLSAQSVAAMEECSSESVSGGEYYQGYPLDYRENMYGRQGIYYHNGNAYGAFTCVSYDSVTGDGVVVLATGSVPAKVDGIYAVCNDINAAAYAVLR
ncbi:putative Serine-type D-Ala-D-Ala carboxypeptidase [uncultured Eubacteriales bacterium]|uniref:Putative Serine-type D-Ala-D-Ala carboxypeptidase n=1 Tax=uncultured Eubacteriales bacterium TaxID=172733 RepID=A0A212JTU9_9FIRM|nr:putative Serine-type D-Ala-D-Ala carboxypeptidase [uncultured Eubacteriales bacterium]